MIRPAAVAGSFYPADPMELRQTVNHYLSEASTDAPAPKAIIVPHAGYIYSGSVAASVYARLKTARQQITRVVLLGPAHRVAFTGIAVSSCDAFATPSGTIPVDKEAVQTACQLPFVGFLEQAQEQEHSIEVQLPFLQEVLENFQIVPLVVGNASADEVCQLINLLWGGNETLIVISSDLSHFHDYDTAKHLDETTSQAIEHLYFEQLDFNSACGKTPVSGLLKFARDKSLAVKKIDLRNSGDTAGDRNRVVGYGAYVIEPVDFRQMLLNLAKNSIYYGLQTGTPLAVNVANYPQELCQYLASFVTLEKHQHLRGCIGMLEAVRPLVVDIAENAFSAAFQDPRFPPLAVDEFEDLKLHISILTPSEPIIFSSEADLLALIIPGVDGLTLQEGNHRGTFLPSVWEQIPDPVLFLQHLKQKAGLPADYWSDTVQIYRYRTEIIE
jgi:AmmeMemoRadiSam system protein B/AmmeMemoRadiSam system protein A